MVIAVEKTVETKGHTENDRNEEGKKETCVHHWLIKEAKGPTSEGRCKKCHEVKNFKNFVDTGTPFKRSGVRSSERGG